MTELLKSLDEQAQSYANEQNDRYGVSWIRTYREKFAELIVRECGKSCTLQGDEDDMFRKFGIKQN